MGPFGPRYPLKAGGLFGITRAWPNTGAAEPTDTVVAINTAVTSTPKPLISAFDVSQPPFPVLAFDDWWQRRIMPIFPGHRLPPLGGQTAWRLLYRFCGARCAAGSQDRHPTGDAPTRGLTLRAAGRLGSNAAFLTFLPRNRSAMNVMVNCAAGQGHTRLRRDPSIWESLAARQRRTHSRVAYAVGACYVVSFGGP